MKWNPMQLLGLKFLGPDRETASVDFRPGVNVLCGASDSGKSFVVESIDFLLGSGKELRDIPERVGYDRGRLEIRTSEKKEFTLERNVEGGSVTRFAGQIGSKEEAIDGEVLGEKHKHDQEDNLSGWVLSQLGLKGARLRKNAKNLTQSLSLRNLAPLALVREDDIIKEGSPFLTGQYVTATAERALLKLLLTGVDDSTLAADKNTEDGRQKDAVRTEILEEAAHDVQTQIEDLGVEEKELRERLEKIEGALGEERESLQLLQSDLNELVAKRKKLLADHGLVSGRMVEIDELLARFELLRSHYDVDLQRLSAIEESGALFSHQEKQGCPLCGAPPDSQHAGDACDGDVEAVVEAAGAEIKKIHLLSEELEQTVRDLSFENDKHQQSASEMEAAFRDVDSKIKGTSTPQVSEQRATFSELVELKGEIKNQLGLFDRLNSIEAMIEGLKESEEEESGGGAGSTTLSKSVVQQLSKRVGRLLKEWNFPSDEFDVYFDDKSADFVIDGKPRGSFGKGFRAITHAAASIALMEHCRENGLPHLGFVVLDSPLLAYWEPEGADDSLKGTGLRKHFYNYLVKHHTESQIIIVENEHAPDEVADQMNVINFTRNPKEGRYGLFPLQKEAG